MRTSVKALIQAGRKITSPVRKMAAVALAMGFGLAASAAFAQPAGYPAASIRLVVPFAAGGGTDFQARTIAHALEPILKQSIIVENRPGAGGNIAAKYVASAKPDGYTLLVGSTGTHGTNEFLYSDLPYDPEADFAPISLLSTFDNVVIVPASSDAKSLSDLVNKARANPGKLNYGITTIGSSSHLAIEHFRREAKLDMTGVPYNGASLATTDLLGGRLDVMLDLISTQIGNIQGKKVRALATTGPKRSPVLPDVPTIAESGFPNFSAIGWIGLFAPAGTSPDILQQLYAALVKAYESPELQETFRSRALDLNAMPPAQFDTYLKEERKKWSTLIREADIKIN